MSRRRRAGQAGNARAHGAVGGAPRSDLVERVLGRAREPAVEGHVDRSRAVEHQGSDRVRVEVEVRLATVAPYDAP